MGMQGLTTGTGHQRMDGPTIQFSAQKKPNRVAVPGRQSNDPFADLRRDPNPLLNGELSRWPFQDLLEAVQFSRPDFAEGKIEVASRYANGMNGAPKSHIMAEQFYRSAALQGDARGQYYLGLFLAEEKDRRQTFFKTLVEQLTGWQFPSADQREAYAWFLLAAEQTRNIEEVGNAQDQLRRMNSWFPHWDRNVAIGQAARLRTQIKTRVQA